MSPATPDSFDAQYFGRLLRELKQSLLDVQATGAAAADTVELDQTRQGRLTRMDALQAQAMSQATNERRLKKLVAIEVALGRVERGDYGVCDECGEQIDPRRLEFDPTVRMCIACAD